MRFPGWGHGEQKRTERGLRGTELVQRLVSRSGTGTGQRAGEAYGHTGVRLKMGKIGQSPFRASIDRASWFRI